MEGSISSLTYKGSISNAIIEAQNQKKLILVFISGEDENSIHLEQSTWVDHNVAEPISRYCIFLHLMHGSVDASQFSAIYPQKSVPSISAVGYNGIMIWQHEGYISTKNLVESIEKAWAALHLQETAATLLSAALSSKKSEPLSYRSPEVASFEEGSSSTSDVAETSADKFSQSPEGGSSSDFNLPKEERIIEPRDNVSSIRSSSDFKLPKEQGINEPRDDKDTRPGEEASSLSDHVSDVEISVEQKSSAANDSGEVLHSSTRDMHISVTYNDGDSSAASAAPQEGLTPDKGHTGVPPKSTGRMVLIGLGSSEGNVTDMEEKRESEKVGGLIDSNAIKSGDMHLSIRLPNGATLQRKFAVTDTLRLVKTYVDENQTTGVQSYDLAIPYPRKVFNEQDMNMALPELGFASRQALIVVPHRQAPQLLRGSSSQSSDSQYAASGSDSSDNNGGYFGFVKRMLSYVNPFSYLGGNSSSSDSAPAARDSLRPYRPNPAVQNHFSGAETSRQPYSLNNQNPSRVDDVGNTGRRTSRPFGSNIHTLRHDEDDFPSGDRNTFWNGNSTQFGGDDKK